MEEGVDAETRLRNQRLAAVRAGFNPFPDDAQSR
jgi:hypothetical protein